MAIIHTPITSNDWKSDSLICPLLEADQVAIKQYLLLWQSVEWPDKDGQFHKKSPDRFDVEREIRFRAEIQRSTTKLWLPLDDLVKSWSDYDEDGDDLNYSHLGDEFTDGLLDELASAENTEQFFAITEGSLSCTPQPIFGTWICLQAFFKRYPNGCVIPITINRCEIGDELFAKYKGKNSSEPTWKQSENNPFYEIDFVKSALDLCLAWLGLEGEYVCTHALTQVNGALLLTGEVRNLPKENLPFLSWHRQRILGDKSVELPAELVSFLEWYANHTEGLVDFVKNIASFEEKLATYFTICRIQWELAEISEDKWNDISIHIIDIRRVRAMYLNGLLALHIVDMFVALIAKHGLDSGLPKAGKDLDKPLADALFEKKAFELAIRPLLDRIPSVGSEIAREIVQAFSSLEATFEGWSFALAREIENLLKNGSIKTWGDLEFELSQGRCDSVRELLLLNFQDSEHSKAITNIILLYKDSDINDANGKPNAEVIAELVVQVRKHGLRAHRNTIHGYHLRKMNLQVVRLGRGFLDPTIVLHPMLLWLALIADPQQFAASGPMLLSV